MPTLWWHDGGVTCRIRTADTWRGSVGNAKSRSPVFPPHSFYCSLHPSIPDMFLLLSGSYAYARHARALLFTYMPLLFSMYFICFPFTISTILCAEHNKNL